MQREPRIPSPTLAAVGKGRFPRRKAAVLERHDAGGWREIGRFGSVRDAGVALDEAIGAGADPGSLRVVETPPSTASRVALILGAVALVVVSAFALYVVFG
jgi:hypothetical protein